MTVDTSRDFPHSAVLQVQTYEDGPMIERAYRWRVEEVNDRLRAVGQYKRGDGHWAELRNPDRLNALLNLAPAYGTHVARTDEGVTSRPASGCDCLAELRRVDCPNPVCPAR